MRKFLLIPKILVLLLGSIVTASAEDNDLALFFNETTVVETATHHPKPLVQVAENLSLITSDQIEAMNAHTLYEILNRVPGLYLAFNGDFGSPASVTIHGSRFEDEHRLVVLIDGIRLNTASNGIALLNGIPVAIIDRLEIIKGPASSTWGSAIGGVINIITKKPSGSEKPRGQVSTTYGKSDSRDLRAEVEGAGAGQGYYLYTGNQHSDGMLGNRYFDNSQAFGKAIFSPSTESKLTVSGGVNTPEWKSGDFASLDERFTSGTKNGFAGTNYAYTLSSAASVYLDGSLTSNDQTNDATVLGVGVLGPPGVRFLHQSWEEQRASLSGRIVYTLDRQVIVIGAEGWHDQLDYHLASVPSVAPQYGRLPENYRAEQAENNNYAAFVSDTFRFAKLAVIPGIRYDDNSLGEGFVSPSLGGTYPLSDDTRLRATIARGYSSPYLGLLKEVSPFFIANPDLGPERIWSAQAGLETKAVPMLLLKTTTFYHDIDDVWSFNSGGMIVNQGNSRRTGFEVELETTPWHRLVLATSLAFTHDRPEEGKNDDFSRGTVKVGYTNPAMVDMELFGSYVHWLDAATYMATGDNFIWDLNIARKLAAGGSTSVDIFSTLHNLTDADQYWSIYYPNPGRWLEVGLRFHF